MTQVKALVESIDKFIKGCKEDSSPNEGVSNWDAIKACCIMSGWNGLNGALVPLKGDAPTNFNFVSADYDRVTGLKGDGSTKYLDSNRSNSADPKNNNHNFVYMTEGPDSECALMGAGGPGDIANNIGVSGNGNFFVRNRSSDSSSSNFIKGFVATSRFSAEGYDFRRGEETIDFTYESGSPISDNVFIFGRSVASLLPTDARMSIYGIGEAIDLAALDARVTTLMTEIEAALT